MKSRFSHSRKSSTISRSFPLCDESGHQVLKGQIGRTMLDDDHMRIFWKAQKGEFISECVRVKQAAEK